MPRRKKSNRKSRTPPMFGPSLPPKLRRKFRQRRRVARGGGSGSNQMLMNMAHMVCATSNPFCPEAEGAKLFDVDTIKSITFHQRQAVSITTDANGAGVIIVGCCPLASTFKATTIVAGTVTVWDAGTNNSFYTTYSTTAAKWRVVSAGIKIKTTQAWTAAVGIYALSEIPSFVSTTQFPDVGALNQGLRTELLAVRDTNIGAIMRPQGKIAEDYQAMSTFIYPHTGFMLTVSGATASSTLGYIEVIINYEWLPSITSGFQSMASPAAQNVPTVMNARADALSHVPLVANVESTAYDPGWVANAITSVENFVGIGAGVVGTGAQAYQSLGPVGRAAVRAGGMAMIM